MQKRVLAVHDVSAVGKCSLTVALPIISMFGIEASALPTAVLSTHTGGFTGFTYRDLTGDLVPMMNHWQSLDIRFDGIYTGFLGSFEQCDIVKDLIKRFKKDTVVIVDPVMADNGRLYEIFDSNFPAKMKTVCQSADIIIPNITEAALILGEKYIEGPYEKSYIEGLLLKLSELAPKAVLTGVYFDDRTLGAAAFDEGKITYVTRDKVPGYYHGTGDVFGSVLTGAVIDGKTLEEAAAYAVDFTVDAILRTKEAGTEPRYGVNFEAGISKFVRDYR
jgi:pyridoxine kinase